MLYPCSPDASIGVYASLQLPDASIGVYASLQLPVVLLAVARGVVRRGGLWFKERRAKVGKFEV